MRRFVSCLAIAGCLAGPVQAAECLHPADHVALDVVALKTQLMVTALTCQANEKYDAFIMKYRPDLQREDKSLNGYFTRSYGRSGTKQRDDYVTQLANSQSQIGLRQGSLFCEQNLGTFEEVMALKSTTELADYAAGRAGPQPISTVSCTGAAPTAARRASTPARRR